MHEQIVISLEEYEGLLEDRRKLTALENAGVDNWSMYDSAMEFMDYDYSQDD